MGFRPSDADAGLLYRDEDSGRTWLLVYVDDTPSWLASRRR